MEETMPLTTVASGRVYDWSHAVGRGAARGTGFNYIQTMCLGKGGVIYTANRGNENNFGMHVNKVKLGGPGEEELIADFFEYGEGDGHCTWPFGVAVDNNDHLYASDEWENTISVFDSSGKFLRKFGKTGSGDGELLRPAGLAIEKNGNLIVVDSGNNRLQVFSPDGKFVGKCGSAGNRPGEFNQPWGIPLDNDGNIFVADWGNQRVCIFDSEGNPITSLIGDAQVLSKWGQQSIDANPDMMKARRRVKSLEPQWRFCFPTAVDFDPDSDSVIIADSQRNRLQIYKKVRDYTDFQANL